MLGVSENNKEKIGKRKINKKILRVYLDRGLRRRRDEEGKSLEPLSFIWKLEHWRERE